MLQNTKVPMPKKKITYKTAANGTNYVYYTLRAYRNKHGKATSEQVAIGKKDKETGLLVPNSRYFEIFKTDKPTATCEVIPHRIRNCGNTAALLEIAKQTGVAGILKKCFPEKWRKILACAFYMLCEGNIMLYIGDWFEETKVEFTESMDDVDCSKLFASIAEEEREVFFREWVQFRC